MAIIAVKLYGFCAKHHLVIKMPDNIPPGVSQSFTSLIPTAVIVFTITLIHGSLIALGTDLFKILHLPFGFVTYLTNTWCGLIVIYFFIHALWIVGIHGANIITFL